MLSTISLNGEIRWSSNYVQAGIPINELEKYVPFIPTRPLRKDEAETLRTVFGTGVKDAHQDNFDTPTDGSSEAGPQP